MQSLIIAVVGVLLLTFGWKLFWMFVGVVGFVAGLQAAQLLLGPQPFWMLWAAGLFCGIIGAVLALFFQHLAVAIGGFIAGAILASQLVMMGGYPSNGWIVLIGGVIGAVALVLLFDWALVALSSMAGAALVVNAIVGQSFPYALWLFLVVTAAGVIFQSRLLLASRKSRH
ncbi:MAG: hypothetical protein P8010_14850 [Desulfosarcinaceae bacterium]